MGNNKTLELLSKVQQMIIEKVISKDVNTNTLYKLGRIQKTFSNILSVINTRTNSIHIIMLPDEKYGIIINNVEKENDHVSIYQITIHESGETFQIEDVRYNNLVKSIITRHEEIN